MSQLNPYEPPKIAEERIPSQRRRKLIVAVAIAVAAGLIIGGMATFEAIQKQRVTAMRAELRRQQQSVAAESLRAREAATRAENP